MQVVVEQPAPFPDPVIVDLPQPPWETLPPPVFLLIVVAVVAGAVFILAPLARALARRIEGGAAPQLRSEVADLRARLEAIEQQALPTGEFAASDQRMYELEERVEFVERLMSRGNEGRNEPR
jgi:hypothetical protein